MSQFRIVISPFLVGCLSLVLITVNGQQAYQPAKVIPPSPTAASMEAYGNLAVSYYTGIPNINIPVYQIKTTNHSLAINLNYNPIGVHVGEEASWVGLGWSLSSGGAITRTVVGLDDFGSNGYYVSDAIPASADPMTPAGKSYFDVAVMGGKDIDPDIYSYNFFGHSGKFVMGKFSDGSRVFMDKQNNLKVAYQTGKWIVTDGLGYKYYFSVPEVAYGYFYSSSSNEIADNAPLSAFQASTGPASTNAWYIDSAVAPSGEKIVFNYLVKSSSVSIINKSEQQDNLLDITGSCSSGTPSMAATYKRFSASRQVVPDVYLTKIIFNQGTIDFNTSDREDIEYINIGKPQKLAQIVIKDLAGTQVKRYDLHYSYFNAAANLSGRLKLDSVVEHGSGNTAKPAYKLTYSSPNSLPPKYSKSIDHWGFYNGKSNTTLLPPLLVISPITGQYNYFPGADRTPSDNDMAMKAGTISSITYPTGGSTVFDFELNDYGNLQGEDRYVPTPFNPSVTAHPGDPSTHANHTFTITEATPVHFSYYYTKAAAGPDLMDGVLVVYGYLSKQGVAGNMLSFNNWENDASVGDNVTRYIDQVLAPGTYTLSVTYIQNYLTNLQASYAGKQLINHRKGGGLRIRSITSYANDAQANYREFSYTDNGITTGKVISNPKYAYSSVITENPVNGNCSVYMGYYAGRMSSSVQSPALASTSTLVGYDKVTELIGVNGSGGRNEYYYINSEDLSSSGTPSTPAAFNPLNGTLVLISTYNAANVLVKKTDYIYGNKKQEALTGVKIFAPPATGGAPAGYQVTYYDIYSNWATLNGEEETLYDNNGTIRTSKRYYYDNEGHKEVTRQEFTKSDGQTLITKFKRPGDYLVAGSSSFAADMQSKNIVSPVIEQQTLVKTLSNIKKLTSGSFTEYKLFNNKFYKPGTVYRLLASSSIIDTTESSINAMAQVMLHANYQPEIYFDQYTDNGNVLQLHKRGDASISYVWDYLSDYPVAEIKNATVDCIAYTSFEAGGMGGWTMNPGSTINTNGGITGTHSFSGGLSMSVPAGNYTVTLWSLWNGSSTVNGVTGAAIYRKGAYELRMWKLANISNVTIAADAIDEARLYPEGAEMTTSTYNPLRGITDQCDVNNRIVYYEYDGFGRLLRVRDDEKNIIKQYDYRYRVPANNGPVWQAISTTRCKPCAGNSNYSTNILQNGQIDINPNSNTYGDTAWIDAGTSGSCVITADWQYTAMSRCQTINGESTGAVEREKRDVNLCSPSYSQTIWEFFGTDCAICPTNPDWQPTGSYRCAKDANNVNTGRRERQEINQRNCSSVPLHTFRWVDDSEACVGCPLPENWQATGNTRCQKNQYNSNTSYQEIEQQNLAACVPAYRWVLGTSNTTACPLCVKCFGENRRCINDQCVFGVKIYTGSSFNTSTGKYECTYHYEFPNGSWSGDYVEQSNIACFTP